MWYSLAANDGDQEAMASKNLISKKMSKDETDQAALMIKDCFNSDYNKCFW